jgi:hypothetical protein
MHLLRDSLERIDQQIRASHIDSTRSS